ncbi:Arylsulfatase A [Paenibacillus sp. UNC496MF]|uniref:sulfatase family protein n=1 Tax=Paenibacillus sp. UNC496MF TaxID=1502753 RepID=UPI0008EA5106|nr:sulfatase [Paenibacillus sp. UNC496MF]SFJ76377.1 Arylsulfatase A [Paenibacillus sp. UNC496MF]
MKPNILLITADDLNYNSPGVTGCGVRDVTPNIDRLAGEGIRFRHAHVTSAVCQPSRSVLMTGKYPHQNGALGFEPINDNVCTLQELLRQAGYYNGIIGKEAHLAPTWKFCWDSFITTMDEENGFGRSPEVYYTHTKHVIEQAKQAGKPFFLMANSHDPHRPFAGSEQELKKFGRYTKASRHYTPEEIEVPGFLPDLPDIRKELAQYFTSVHRCDETVGEILRALKESGLEEQTLVMFLSDNGMAFPFAKTNCYLTSTRTPWIIRWPGRVKPGTVDEEHMISGIDFMPTVLETVGLNAPEDLNGDSFLPLLTGGKQVHRTKVFTFFTQTAAKRDFPMRCVQNRRLGYIYNAWSDQETAFKNESQSGRTFKAMEEAAQHDEYVRRRTHFFQYRVREELYDFEQDPDALVNLIDEPEYRQQLADFQSDMLNMMESTGDPLTQTFQEHLASR